MFIRVKSLRAARGTAFAHMLEQPGRSPMTSIRPRLLHLLVGLLAACAVDPALDDPGAAEPSRADQPQAEFRWSLFAQVWMGENEAVAAVGPFLGVGAFATLKEGTGGTYVSTKVWGGKVNTEREAVVTELRATRVVPRATMRLSKERDAWRLEYNDGQSADLLKWTIPAGSPSIRRATPRIVPPKS
jgi:hypothetical protein